MQNLVGPFALLLAPSVLSQAVYDAGTPGNPTAAPSPVAQGWSKSVTGTGGAGRLSPDPAAPLNAWQLADAGPGRVLYSRPGPWLGNDSYECELVMRPLAGEVTLELVAGPSLLDNVFELVFVVVGADVHLLRPGATSIVFPDAASDYHGYRFLSGFGANDVDVFFDGAFAGRRGYDSFGSAQSARVAFGTGDAAPGRARVHFVRFGRLVDHDWGTPYCTPASVNSSGGAGTTRLFGSIHTWQNHMELRAAGLPVNQFGYFLTSRTQDSAPVGQGTLCLGGAIGRFNLPGQIRSSGSSGALELALDTSAIPTPTGFVSMDTGTTWNFQCWFRDANPGPGSNLTDAVEVTLAH